METGNCAPAMQETGNCAPECSKSQFDTLPVQQQLSVLKKKVDELNMRENWQEHIHRNILDNGNITHYYNIMPTIIISALVGFATAAAFIYLKNKVKTA